uniref:Uncharacterized protein n=1 Tax=Romanomermis culicivorax TaxID=13658 RepID=A0A915HIH6_ROMCU
MLNGIDFLLHSRCARSRRTEIVTVSGGGLETRRESIALETANGVVRKSATAAKPTRIATEATTSSSVTKTATTTPTSTAPKTATAFSITETTTTTISTATIPTATYKDIADLTVDGDSIKEYGCKISHNTSSKTSSTIIAVSEAVRATTETTSAKPTAATFTPVFVPESSVISVPVNQRMNNIGVHTKVSL